jgi:hypothetical protein
MVVTGVGKAVSLLQSVVVVDNATAVAAGSEQDVPVSQL